jgi:protein phosphatase
MQRPFFLHDETVWYGNSHKGLKRANNEDSFHIDSEKGYCLVADGMGGAAAGEVASQYFTHSAKAIFSRRRIRSEAEALTLIKEVFILANRKILDHSKSNPKLKGMGCTAELLAITGENVVIGHVGDSRTYRFRNGKLKQMTKDHSLVQKQLDAKQITEAEARTHPLRNIILQAVGIQSMLELDLIRVKAIPDDLFMLCSDGLTDMVDETEIEKALLESSELPAIVDRLIDLANSSGGNDNITVVVCKKK